MAWWDDAAEAVGSAIGWVGDAAEAVVDTATEVAEEVTSPPLMPPMPASTR